MASNFEFLKENWNFLLDDAERVETFALRDPRTAAFYARRTLERALGWLFDNDTALKAPYEKSLAAMIYEPTFKNNIKRGLFNDIRYIHKLGNLAVHAVENISPQEGMKACVAIHTFTGWLARVYTRGGPAPTQFNPLLLPEDEDHSQQVSVVEMQQIREKLAKKDEAEKSAKLKHQQTEKKLEQLKEKLALLQAVKQENIKNIPSDDYTESQTRDEFIDVMLREAGWDPKGKNVEEFEISGMPGDSGVGKVDYVLWGENRLPLAVVEAKRTKADPKTGKRQAELYADCLEKQFKQRPVIFYTNGYSTWLWNDTEYPPRSVEGFYTRDQLQLIINRRASKLPLTQQKINTNITDRPYSFEAAARIMEQFDTLRKRKALVVMATGTGKTRLSIALVDMLLKANWVKRVLFLADRIALVQQAKREFNKHLPHVSVASLLDKKQEDARVLFSTYPTMLNLIDGTKKDQTDTFSVGHFDLIIIDEAHRSVYQKYGAIFEYFDSLLLGLTATPRGEIDRNTYKLFELNDYQPTFCYELSQAVDDGFLVPPKALSVPLKFQREGIKYDDLSDEEQAEYEAQEQFYDVDTGELKEEIGSAALNQWLFNKDTVNKVLLHLMENGLKVEGGDKLGKTIIFAKNSKHANFIVEQFDENYPHLKGKFCQKVDYSVKYAQSLIDDFSVKEKMPQIAVSVDMLDTGIDVPEVLNLVFFKLVRSKTKFWQMVGRGTRLCPDLFALGDDKQCFYIFDYCQNLEFFGENPSGYEAPIQASVKQTLFKRRLQLAVGLQESQGEDKKLQALTSSLKDQMHAIVNGLNLNNFIIRKQRKTVETFADRNRWEQISEQDIADIEEKLTALPSQDDDHVTARRFDLLVLNLQLAILQNNTHQQRYQQAIRDLAKNLAEKSAIPMVATQMKLILALQTDDWWQDVTLPLLEQVRLNLRDLIKFVDNQAQNYDTYTDFKDDLPAGEISEYEIVKTDPNMIDYRRRVEKIIRDHQDHITIRRLKNNQPVSQTDIDALEAMLFAHDNGISKEEYNLIYGGKPVGILVRSIVGLSRKAAKEAFAEFLKKSPLHPDQISFLNEVVEFLVQNGLMEPKQMFDAPFTHYHDQGVVGIMGQDLAEKVVALVKVVNRNADVA